MIKLKDMLNEARKPDMDEKQFKAIRKQLTKVRDEMVKSIKMVGKTFDKKDYNELKKVFGAFGDFEIQFPINVRNSWKEVGYNETD